MDLFIGSHNCWNKEALTKYADQMTVREGVARLQYPLGCFPGNIACSGCIENPVFGDMCSAELSEAEIPERPTESQNLNIAAKVSEIPGFEPMRAAVEERLRTTL